MTSDKEINDIIRILDDAQNILGEILPDDPDMEITKWNQSPVGRATRKISRAIELLEDLP